MTDKLRTAHEVLSDFVAMGEQYGWDNATTGRDILMRDALAALAAAPQPAPCLVDHAAMATPECMTCGAFHELQLGPASNIKNPNIATADREALVEVIEAAATSCPQHIGFSEAIADALLAAGWTRGGDAAYAAGQRDMQERAADTLAQGLHVPYPMLAESIRALPIKDRPDGD